MDTTNLRTGEKIAGVSGILLIIIMFVFGWFGIDGVPGSANAWESFSIIDLILFVTVVAAVALAATAASQTAVNLPVALSAIVAGLGVLSVILVLFRIISPPDFGAGGFGVEVDATRKIGVFLGLIAAGGVAYGGFVAMQEEGTSFSDQADRVQGGGGSGPAA